MIYKVKMEELVGCNHNVFKALSQEGKKLLTFTSLNMPTSYSVSMLMLILYYH